MFSSMELSKELTSLYNSLVKNRQYIFKIDTKNKSLDKSMEFRTVGNASYRCGRDEEALIHYSKGIAIAPKDSEELALLYANRSAALFNLHRYIPCLLDINRALNGKYPEQLKQKLHDRKLECLMKIRAEDELKTKAFNKIKDSRPYNSKFLTYHERFMFTPSQITGEETDPIESDVDDLGWKAKLLNPLLPNTSSKVKIAFNDQWGRHVVATDDIEPGEIISIEEFFSLLMFAQDEPVINNCCYCLKWCQALVPCDTCCAEMYCSETCRKKAYDSYHRTECKLLCYTYYTQLNRNHRLALRTFLTGTQQGDQLKELIKNPALAEMFLNQTTFIDKQFVFDYVSVLKLEHKFHYEGEKLQDLLIESAAIMLILKDSSFFGNDTDEDKATNFNKLTTEEVFAGLLLLNNLSSMRYSAFSITEEKVGPANEFRGDAIMTGIGICSFQSFLNHSCNANSGNTVRGRDHVIYSIRPIKTGEQIFFPYGFRYGDLTLAIRTERLVKTHGIICGCEACVGDWPLFINMRYHNTRFKTSKPNKIRLIQTIHDESMRRSVSFHKRNKYFGHPAILYEWCQKIHKYVEQPSQTAVVCESLIILAMKEKGNIQLNFSFEDFVKSSVPLCTCDGASISTLLEEK